MKNIQQILFSLSLCISITACGGGGGGGSIHTNTQPSSSSSSSSNSELKATSDVVSIPVPSLAGNLTGEASEHNIRVFLPKAYYTAKTQLFPVIYYLPGFGDTTMLNVSMPSDLDSAQANLNPAIIVIVDGVNAFGGSFYVNSPVTGNWADLVTQDTVQYVDAHYRTIPNKRGRGIAGHSMGGFGALNLAMRNADLFSVAFALSPGLVGTQGMADTQMFSSPTHIRDVLTVISGANVKLSTLRVNANAFDIAYGLAFAPTNSTPYFDYPYSLSNNTLVLNDAIMAKWESGFGNIHNEIAEFSSNLSGQHIGLDCGLNDEYGWIPRGCAYFDAELTAANLAHQYTTHTGDHQSRLAQRIREVMLPFFSENLAKE